MNQLAQSQAESEGKDTVMTRLVFAEAKRNEIATEQEASVTETEEPEQVPVVEASAAVPEAAPVVPLAKPADGQKHDGSDDEEGNKQLVTLANAMGEALEGVNTGASIEFTHSADGVLIRIMDNDDFGMFAVGSSEPHPDVVKAMEKIAKVLEEEKGEIIIRGHTDARPFKSRKNDNWRLSTARAHMAYFMLVRGGLDENRIIGIEGYADRRLKEVDDPYAPQNRRIEIMLTEGQA